jgi:hypothetical protein
MPILKGTGNTLLCSRFGYGKRISTRAKSVNSENRHRNGELPLTFGLAIARASNAFCAWDRQVPGGASTQQ